MRQKKKKTSGRLGLLANGGKSSPRRPCLGDRDQCTSKLEVPAIAEFSFRAFATALTRRWFICLPASCSRLPLWFCPDRSRGIGGTGSGKPEIYLPLREARGPRGRPLAAYCQVLSLLLRAIPARTPHKAGVRVQTSWDGEGLRIRRGWMPRLGRGGKS